MAAMYREAMDLDIALSELAPAIASGVLWYLPCNVLCWNNIWTSRDCGYREHACYI